MLQQWPQLPPSALAYATKWARPGSSLSIALVKLGHTLVPSTQRPHRSPFSLEQKETQEVMVLICDDFALNWVDLD